MAVELTDVKDGDCDWLVVLIWFKVGVLGGIEEGGGEEGMVG